MKKWKMIRIKIIMVMMLMFLIPAIASAYTEIQWGLDNSTWQHAAFTNDNNITLEVLGNGVDSDTQYFFRLRHIYNNTISNWTYVDAETLSGGFDEKMFSIIFGIGIVMTLFILLGIKNKGTGVRYLFFGYALIQAVQIFSLVYLEELGLSIVSTLKVNFWSLVLLSFAIAVYASWKLMVKLIAPGEEGKVEEEKWQD